VRVVEVDVEAVPPAGRRPRGGQRDARPRCPLAADEVDQRAPPTAQVEYAPARSDPDLLGQVSGLAPLGLFPAQREVTVVLGRAEVGGLSQVGPEDAIGQRVRPKSAAHARVRRPGTRPGPTTTAPRAQHNARRARSVDAGDGVPKAQWQAAWRPNAMQSVRPRSIGWPAWSGRRAASSEVLMTTKPISARSSGRASSVAARRGMAISLADPAGPIDAAKESMAVNKIVLEAAQAAGPARLVGAAARPGGMWAGG
jgi:hypothetical protein